MGDRLLSRQHEQVLFSHSFAGGYSAGYYSYVWSEVLDSDTVEWFKKHRGLKRENGDRFREMLLSRGGSADALSLFKNFVERHPYLERCSNGAGSIARPAPTIRRPKCRQLSATFGRAELEPRRPRSAASVGRGGPSPAAMIPISKQLLL